MAHLSFLIYNIVTNEDILAEGDRMDAVEEVSPADSSGQARFAAAERKIVGASLGVAHGNSEEAHKLAEDFSGRMKVLRELMFTEGEDRIIEITDGEFITYCELHEDRCAFLVHVPAYRDFKGEAKEQLASLAWQTAQRVVEETLEEGDQLGIGMKGTFLYGSVMVGSVGSETPTSSSKEKDLLIGFFPDEVPDLESEEEP